jgi:hypothetical protein
MAPSRTRRVAQSSSTGIAQERMPSCFSMVRSRASACRIATKPGGWAVGSKEVISVIDDGLMSTTLAGSSGVSRRSQVTTSALERETG